MIASPCVATLSTDLQTDSPHAGDRTLQNHPQRPPPRHHHLSHTLSVCDAVHSLARFPSTLQVTTRRSHILVHIYADMLRLQEASNSSIASNEAACSPPPETPGPTFAHAPSGITLPRVRPAATAHDSAARRECAAACATGSRDPYQRHDGRGHRNLRRRYEQPCAASSHIADPECTPPA